MAINISDGFNVTTSSPVDTRLVLTKSGMKMMNDKKMPQVYFCICSEDNNIYLYNKSNDYDDTLGRFRLYEAEEETESYDYYILDGGQSSSTF